MFDALEQTLDGPFCDVDATEDLADAFSSSCLFVLSTQREMAYIFREFEI